MEKPSHKLQTELVWREPAGSISARWEEIRANNFPDKMKKMKPVARRDGRVAEGARLESVYTFTGIGGSNPSLSASSLNT
jgi:hypothetical protein